MKKIVQNRGVFFVAQNNAVFSPRQPRNAPRLHQQNTTINSPIFSQPPAKNPAKSNKNTIVDRPDFLT
jgi:hypothetical protein